jgi:hypothetical protein
MVAILEKIPCFNSMVTDFFFALLSVSVTPVDATLQLVDGAARRPSMISGCRQRRGDSEKDHRRRYR